MTSTTEPLLEAAEADAAALGWAREAGAADWERECWRDRAEAAEVGAGVADCWLEAAREFCLEAVAEAAARERLAAEAAAEAAARVKLAAEAKIDKWYK